MSAAITPYTQETDFETGKLFGRVDFETGAAYGSIAAIFADSQVTPAFLAGYEIGWVLEAEELAELADGEDEAQWELELQYWEEFGLAY